MVKKVIADFPKNNSGKTELWRPENNMALRKKITIKRSMPCAYKCKKYIHIAAGGYIGKD